MGSHTRWRTTVLLNLASIIERADEQVLPAVYHFISLSFHCSPSELGTLTLCRAMVQALSSPLSGVLGDKYDRTHIVAFGCFLWGIMTTAIGFSTSIYQAMVWSAFNGLGLALVVPCIASLTADYHPAESRGRAFGLMAFTSGLGGMFGGFFATNVGHFRFGLLDGWRLAFHFVALISLICSLMVLKFAADPRKKQGLISPLLLGEQASASAAKLGSAPLLTDSGRSPSLKSLAMAGRQAGVNQVMPFRLKDMWSDVITVLRIPTFQILILQGIVGSTPWNAMVFFTMWLQLMGFSDFTASSLMAIFACGCAMGAYLGGVIGDYMGTKWPNGGRVAACQCSVLMGLPLSCLLLKGLPTVPVGDASTNSLAMTYAGTMLVMGATISWCGTNNSAIFAEIVPEDKRTSVYAFDRSFEGAVAACAAPVVGILAEKVFHYDAKEIAEGGIDHNLENAASLSSALLVSLIIPWGLCFFFYFGLYRTYPKDRLGLSSRRSMSARTQDP